MRGLVTGAAGGIGRATDARYVNGHDLVVDGGLTGRFLGRPPGLPENTRA